MCQCGCLHEDWQGNCTLRHCEEDEDQFDSMYDDPDFQYDALVDDMLTGGRYDIGGWKESEV